MAASIYRLNLAHDAVGDASVALDIRDNGILDELVATYTQINDSGNSLTFWEASFSSSPSFQINDTRSAICGGPILTSDLLDVYSNAVRATPKIQVSAGERIYLHLRNKAALPAEMEFNVWMSVSMGMKGARNARGQFVRRAG